MILHGRIAWIVGEWVTSITESMRSEVYSAIGALLGHSDLAVALLAANALTLLLKDMEFDAATFQPQLAAATTALLSLLRKVETMENKLLLLSTLTHLISEMKRAVRCSSSIFAHTIRLCPPRSLSYGWRLACGRVHDRSTSCVAPY